MEKQKSRKEKLLGLKAQAYDLLKRRGKLLQEVAAIDKILAEINEQIDTLERENSELQEN